MKKRYSIDSQGVLRLTDGLHHNGRLELSGQNYLTKLPDSLSVTETVDLRYCTNLKALPANLTVGGDLILWDCRRLVSMAERVSVKGSLYLINCPRLTALGEDLMVGSTLQINDCAGIRSLPAILSVGGWITFDELSIIRMRSQIALDQNLPESVVAMLPGKKLSDVIDSWALQDAGLADRAISWAYNHGDKAVIGHEDTHGRPATRNPNHPA